MPPKSLIVGVDLAPIKPIPRAITFQSDITTDKCRATLRSHLKTWKADTVLHDGAPNVGTAWVQDAFSQAELVLQSLKLATEFLVEGGTFVTKVFRSKDYNALLWVFKQLFTFVEATKPPSSRNVSAEIFVVCRGFKAPRRIDPRFLDPRHVFAELSAPTPNNEAKVFNPEKKKRKREGYEEGDYTQNKVVPVSDFVNSSDPIAILGTVHGLSFDQNPNGDLALATLSRLPETTDEIKTCCSDLRVLGKKEFRSLLKWRLKVREKFGLSTKVAKKATEDTEEVASIEPMDEELAIQEELQRLKDQESSRKKKERRKENERKQREIYRMQMNMTTPTDIGMEQNSPFGEDSMFTLKAANKASNLEPLANGKMSSKLHTQDESESDEATESDYESDPEEDRLDRELDSLYGQYLESRDSQDIKKRAKKARKEIDNEEWDGFSDSERGSDADSEDDSETDEDNETEDIAKVNGSISDLSSKAAMFFDQDLFQGIEGMVEDGDADIQSQDKMSKSQISRNEKRSDQSGDQFDQRKKTTQDSTKPLSQADEDWEDTAEGPRMNDNVERAEDPRKSNGQLGMRSRSTHALIID